MLINDALSTIKTKSIPGSGLLYVESNSILGWRGTGHNGARGEEKGTFQTGRTPRIKPGARD